MNDYSKNHSKLKKLELSEIVLSYKELIKEDKFDKKESHFVEGSITKLCWSCETAHKKGYMVKDISKGRKIFFCQGCYDRMDN